MATRTYVADLPGGTATTSVQIQANGSLKEVALSMISAAVGKVEISLSASPQIGTAQPTADVIGRFNLGATGGYINTSLQQVSVPLKAFQNVYIHQTGAGNLGNVNLVI